MIPFFDISAIAYNYSEIKRIESGNTLDRVALLASRFVPDTKDLKDRLIPLPDEENWLEKPVFDYFGSIIQINALIDPEKASRAFRNTDGLLWTKGFSRRSDVRSYIVNMTDLFWIVLIDSTIGRMRLTRYFTLGRRHYYPNSKIEQEVPLLNGFYFDPSDDKVYRVDYRELYTVPRLDDGDVDEVFYFLIHRIFADRQKESDQNSFLLTIQLPAWLTKSNDGLLGMLCDWSYYQDQALRVPEFEYPIGEVEFSIPLSLLEKLKKNNQIPDWLEIQ